MIFCTISHNYLRIHFLRIPVFIRLFLFISFHFKYCEFGNNNFPVIKVIINLALFRWLWYFICRKMALLMIFLNFVSAFVVLFAWAHDNDVNGEWTIGLSNPTELNVTRINLIFLRFSHFSAAFFVQRFAVGFRQPNNDGNLCAQKTPKQEIDIDDEFPKIEKANNFRLHRFGFLLFPFSGWERTKSWEKDEMCAREYLWHGRVSSRWMSNEFVNKNTNENILRDAPM